MADWRLVSRAAAGGNKLSVKKYRFTYGPAAIDASRTTTYDPTDIYISCALNGPNQKLARGFS
jgi:hypothetical protein